MTNIDTLLKKLTPYMIDNIKNFTEDNMIYIKDELKDVKRMKSLLEYLIEMDLACNSIVQGQLVDCAWLFNQMNPDCMVCYSLSIPKLQQKHKESLSKLIDDIEGLCFNSWYKLIPFKHSDNELEEKREEMIDLHRGIIETLCFDKWYSWLPSNSVTDDNNGHISYAMPRNYHSYERQDAKLKLKKIKLKQINRKKLNSIHYSYSDLCATGIRI